MRSRGAVVATSIVGLVLAMASVAWACTIQARIVAVTPGSGTERSALTVRGEGLGQSSTGAPLPVEIRWNALDGPVVGTAVADPSGNFSAEVTVPEAAPGVYSLLVVAEGAGLGRTAFEVTPSAVAPVPASPSPVADAWAGDSAGVASPDAPAAGLGLTVGVGMLAVGLVALFSGFTVAVSRRRPARVRRHS
ncbi:MAG TPA: hypothetical protein VK988_04895 [Acidimicrobiales bacterium]|nr:hypothetical protein [Acidimicrobiales bacterium]